MDVKVKEKGEDQMGSTKFGKGRSKWFDIEYRHLQI